MYRKAISALVAGAALASAQCIIPGTPPSGTISAPFRLQVQNISRPDVHDKYMNLDVAGGGDRHLFIGPVGNPTFDLTLVDGVINWVAGGIRAVIGGEFSDIDHTTKLFMTGRGDPRAVFEPTYACNPDAPTETQIELRFVTWRDQPAGGWICVRPSYDNSHEFRYYPPGNALVDVNRECVKVTLVIRFSGSGPSTTVSSPPSTSVAVSTVISSVVVSSTIASTSTTTTVLTSTLTSTSTSVSATSTTSTSTSTVPASTNTALPYTDMTAQGFRYIGCAPEERRTVPFDFYGRTLPSALYAEDQMTNEKCMAYCSNAGYTYAGTEWSRECWCANSYAATRQPGTTLASVANCNYKCSGSQSQFCGGDAWLSLYEKCPAGGPCVNNVFT